MRTTTTGPELRFMQLDVYRVARDIVGRVVELGVKDAELEAQVTRAAKSLLLNLAEGLPSRSAGTRRRHFAIALGSAYEVAAAVDAAALLGVADRAAVGEVLALCDRVSAMLNRMR